MSDLQYTIIQHTPRKKRGLSLIEYCVADSIYHLSNNPEYHRCIKSKESMADELGISRRNIFIIIDKLVKEGLVTRDENIKGLKTTITRYNEFILECKKCTTSAEVIDDSAKNAQETVQKLHTDSAEIALNNNIYNNIYNNKDNILSKDSTTLCVAGEENTSIYIPKEITVQVDYIIDIIKQTCKKYGVVYGYSSKERRYAKHLLSKKFKKECLDQLGVNMEEFIDGIILLSTRLKYGKVVNSPMSIYYNRDENINKSKQQNLQLTPQKQMMEF